MPIENLKLQIEFYLRALATKNRWVFPIADLKFSILNFQRLFQNLWNVRVEPGEKTGVRAEERGGPASAGRAGRCSATCADAVET